MLTVYLKCDGKRPCRRCETRAKARECTYETHLKHAKEDLVKQIKELRASNTISQSILHALLLGTKAAEVLEMLGKGDSLDTNAKILGNNVPTEVTSCLSASLTPSPADSDGHSPQSSVMYAWTSVTRDRFFPRQTAMIPFKVLATLFLSRTNPCLQIL